MKAKTLNSICKIAEKISNPSSLTSLYRSIEIGPQIVRCCSEFGNLELYVEDTGLKEPALIACKDLSGSLTGLPPDDEVTLEQKGNRINWATEHSSGTMSLTQTDYKVPKIKHESFPWIPPADLGNALVLASTACQAAAVSLGLYGIVIEPDKEKLTIASTNTISLACSTVELGTYPAKKVTLRPPVPSIISTLMVVSPNCALDVTDQGIFMMGEGFLAHLPLGSNLAYDVKAIADKFTASVQVAKINPSAVKKFIARAKNLTDKKAAFNISLKVEDGKLILNHTGISSSTEQWLLAEGLETTVAYESKTFAGDMLTFPLEYITDIVLDYLKDQQLVLRGSNPSFLYAVAGN